MDSRIRCSKPRNSNSALSSSTASTPNGGAKVLSAVLPVQLGDVYLRRVGVDNAMDEFTGH